MQFTLLSPFFDRSRRYCKELRNSGESVKEVVVNPIRGLHRDSAEVYLRIAINSKDSEDFDLKDLIRDVYGDINEDSDLWKLSEDLWRSIISLILSLEQGTELIEFLLASLEGKPKTSSRYTYD